jgi:rubrerythrin
MHPKVGDMVLGTDGQWMIRPPQKCAGDHQLARRCVVTSQPCNCQGRHLSWCCDVCGHVAYGPAVGPDCPLLQDPARIR